MENNIKYLPYLNARFQKKINRMQENEIDVLHYRKGYFSETIILNDLTYININKKGETKEIPYFCAPFAEPGDFLIAPYTLISFFGRPMVWIHRKIRPESYKDINLNEFKNEIKGHGGINCVQTISPPKAKQTDYIKCADGQKYIIDKLNKKVLRIKPIQLRKSTK